MEEEFNNLVNKLKLIDEKNISFDIDRNINLILESSINVSQKLNLLKQYYDFILKSIKKTTNEIEHLNNIDTKRIDIDNVILNYQTFTYDNNLHITKSDYLANNTNISNYVSLINSFSTNDYYNLLYEIIPSEQFYDTINKIMAHYLLETITLKKLQNEENTDIFKNEEINLKNIMKNLCCIRDNLKKEIVNNKLVYATTSCNNTIFLNDISAIAPEYYNSIYQAFSSIIDGRFKNNKRLVKLGENIKKPICQVRDNQIRIFYKQLENNLYLILGTVVKKIDCSPHYVSYINNISTISSTFLEQYIKMDSNEKRELLSKGENITQEVTKILTKRR